MTVVRNDTDDNLYEVERLRLTGIELIGLEETRVEVPVTDDPTGVGSVDLLLVCTKAIETEARFIRQSGGRGQFAVVNVRVEPEAVEGGGFEFDREGNRYDEHLAENPEQRHQNIQSDIP